MHEHKRRLSASWGAGLDLLVQEYRAALSDLYSDRSLTPQARLRLVDQLRKEYEQRRAQEIEAISDQRRDDNRVRNK